MNLESTTATGETRLAMWLVLCHCACMCRLVSFEIEY